MTELSQILADVQQDAAAMPDGRLRTEIQESLGVLTMVLDYLQALRADTASAEEMTSATGDVIFAALLIALYVREWTTRPIDRTWARLSMN
jgi:hypothetical protein